MAARMLLSLGLGCRDAVQFHRYQCLLLQGKGAGREQKHNQFSKEEAVSQLRRLVAGFPLRRPGFEPSSGHMEFVVDKGALG
jgi:hypothetical protein